MTLSTLFLHSTLNANCLNKSTGALKNYLRQFTASAFHHKKYYIQNISAMNQRTEKLEILYPAFKTAVACQNLFICTNKKNVQLNLSVENIGMIYYTPAINGNLI